jgi:hypothetical protein
MKNSRFFVLVFIFLSSCAASHVGSYANNLPKDKVCSLMADDITEYLKKTYSPGLTSVEIIPAANENAFGDSLEADLRTGGFMIGGKNDEMIKIKYKIGSVDGWYLIVDVTDKNTGTLRRISRSYTLSGKPNSAFTEASYVPAKEKADQKNKPKNDVQVCADELANSKTKIEMRDITEEEKKKQNQNNSGAAAQASPQPDPAIKAEVQKVKEGFAAMKVTMADAKATPPKTTQSSSVSPPSVDPPPPPPAQPLPAWTLEANHTIGQELQRWADKAGWKIFWNMQQDWAVPATTTFNGSFEDVAGDVIKTLAENGAIIRATIYRGNKTMVVAAPGAIPIK